MKVEHKLDFKLTKDSPQLALMGKLWGVCCEYFEEDVLCYNGIVLYNHNKTKHNNTMSILYGIYCMCWWYVFRCQLIDFHGPTKDGFHPVLFEWVRDYFKKDSEYKPPLYLQHQGEL